MIVTSAQHPQLKLVRRLARRRTREQEGAFVVEGEDLVLAGVETGASARALLVDAERWQGYLHEAGDLDALAGTTPVVQVEPELLASVSELAHPPRVIGVFDLPAVRDLDTAVGECASSAWIVLDGVADPGNVGTVVRTAAALGAAGVVALPGTSDPWGPKAVRASMGSCFRLPLIGVGSGDAVARASDLAQMPLVVLDASGDVDLWDAPLRSGCFVVVGGERDGVSAELLVAADVVARIPQHPGVESLNAGVAASLALYEARRAPGASAQIPPGDVDA